MARTKAKAGYGAQFYRGDGGTPTEVFGKVGEVADLQPPALRRGTADATHMESDGGFMESIALMRESDDVTITVNFVDSDVGQQALVADFDTDTPHNYEIRIPNLNKKYSFAGFITNISPQVAKDAAIRRTFTLKVTGVVTVGAIA